MDTIKQSKTNIIKGSTFHFESEEQYYSYGNKGNYGLVNGSSIGTYGNKKFVKVISSEKSAFSGKLMEELCQIYACSINHTGIRK